jgi:hypothetical protein
MLLKLNVNNPAPDEPMHADDWPVEAKTEPHVGASLAGC